MRPLACAALLAAAQAAAAQEEPKPEAQPEKRAIEFVGLDTIRMPNGMSVHFYRVNYVAANLLVTELDRWKTPNAKITAEGPSYASAKPAPEKEKLASPVTVVQTILRIEETDDNWPVLRRVLDMVDAPPGQVYVEAKIVEVSYDDDLHLGMETHVKRTLADTFFRSADVKFPNRLDALNAFTTTFREEQKYLTFDYILDLAESGAHTSVLAKPGIYVSQGECAVIRVGDNEPIVQQAFQGANVTATTLFKDTGLRLEVQPLLIGRDVVRARISAEASRVSEFRVTATSQSLQVVNPVISTRTADTVVTVPDGEQLVLGGLDSDVDRNQSVGIPLLKDIPILGYAFGSTSRRRQHTEIIFLITFEITAPREARRIVPPSEERRIGER